MKNKCCDCCYPRMVSSEACGCCEGIGIVTPLPTANRPGLSQLAYRIGTHSSFLETMIARLSSHDYPALKGLGTRDRGDSSLAFLDSWATVADVLTFYQERIANEGYLRTATERRSVLELARLVGYRLRPGVSSSVFLAYTIDENTKEEVTVPAGSRAQSVPGPDELPQSFETSETLKARARWNNLKPRMTQPQTRESIRNQVKASDRDDSGQLAGNRTERVRKKISESPIKGPRVYLKGINTNLKPNAPLLIDFGVVGATPEFSRVKEVVPDPIADRTLVALQFSENFPESPENSEGQGTESLGQQPNVQVPTIAALTQPHSLQPRNSLTLKRTFDQQFKEKSGLGYGIVSSFAPELRETLAVAAGNANVKQKSAIRVFALRVEASLFGHNVPKRTAIRRVPNQPDLEGVVEIIGDWPIIEDVPDHSSTTHSSTTRIAHEKETVIHLDARYDNILPKSWIVIKTSESRLAIDKREIVVPVQRVDISLTRSEYGLTAPTTRIEIGPTKWIELHEPPIGTGGGGDLKSPSSPKGDDFRAIRDTTIYAQSEELELAEEPIETVVCGGADDPIELNGFYEGLESGRWVIVSGERDISGTSGVKFSELAMLATVTQDTQKSAGEKSPVESETPSSGQQEKIALPGDKIHTFITLAAELAYCFKRDTVTIYGNVVKATHGETRQEILGSGDGSKDLQSFELKQFPLTHVSASNPTGVDSTLEVLVNDIQWHEADSLAALSSNDRRFITKTNDEDKTTIMFGNGKEGRRLPTGMENVMAHYRNGIGRPGNVRANQISLLASKPLGVKEVINPLRASGGANRENRDQARKNAPLAIKALDRLVSVQDYEDFSRVYAGIGKAHAVELSNGRQQLVHVTIAGAEDIPIDETSDLFRNLRQALHDFGDPHQPIQLAIRELMFVVISARVGILPDYRWETVATDLRSKLLDVFSFERRELGQDVVLSEVLSVMQAVRGVAYVDIEAFGGIPEKKPLSEKEIEILTEKEIPLPANRRRLLTPDEIVREVSDVIKRIDPKIDEEKKEELRNAAEDILSIPQRLVVNLASKEGQSIQPAQIAFLSPDIPDTLILNQIA